jgi:hypothetical protein
MGSKELNMIISTNNSSVVSHESINSNNLKEDILNIHETIVIGKYEFKDVSKTRLKVFFNFINQRQNFNVNSSEYCHYINHFTLIDNFNNYFLGLKSTMDESYVDFWIHEFHKLWNKFINGDFTINNLTNLSNYFHNLYSNGINESTYIHKNKVFNVRLSFQVYTMNNNIFKPIFNVPLNH